MKDVAEVAAIPDPYERAAEAASLARWAEDKAEKLRNRRELAVLIMLRPFADAVAQTNAARARLRERLDAGEITEDEYTEGLAENREQRQKDLANANVEVYPVHIYKMLGVSRNLVNRTLMRMPDGDLPTMSDPARSAKHAHSQLPEVEGIIEQAREIRDTAILTCMEGEDDAGQEWPRRSNADLARATHLTTARVAQLREGSR